MDEDESTPIHHSSGLSVFEEGESIIIEAALPSLLIEPETIFNKSAMKITLKKENNKELR